MGLGAWTIVAGSTWPGDEVALLTAYAGFRASCPQARLVIVPHEPTRSRIGEITHLSPTSMLITAQGGQIEVSRGRLAGGPKAAVGELGLTEGTLLGT